MGKIFKGREVADNISEKLVKRVDELKKKGKSPTLAILRVGVNPSDLAYERGAVNRAEKIGVKTRILELDETSTTDEVLEKIDVLNSDDTVHGVLIFRPLPKHIDDDKVRNRLKADKDVDGIGDVSMAKIYRGDTSGFAPCTAKACIEILKHFAVEIKGKKAVVIGRSMVIGKPVAMMLLNENATVTICHSKSEKLSKIIAENEIVISAVGRANTVTAECTCGNQKIIDVGINVHESGKMVGDVDFENVFGEVYGITPVPGGVGAVTTSILMDHVVRAAEMDCNRK